MTTHDATNFPPSAQAPEPCIRNKPPCRLLVAEDEAELRMLPGVLFHDMGWQVDEAADGLEALAKMQTQFYDLVLLDYRMPGLNGAEVYDHLRKEGKEPPVVLVTAAKQVAEIASTHGIPRFLGKPFGIDDLLRVVDDIAPHC